VTFAPVGGNLYTTTTSLTMANQAVTDLLLVEVVASSATVWCNGISGGGATWTQIGAPFLGNYTSRYVTLFAGKVTATGAATATLTFSGTTPAFYCAGHEFSSTVGYWTVDGPPGAVDHTAITTIASLTPAAAGDLYFGYAFDAGTATAGATTGYTYAIDAGGNGMCWNAACTSAAQNPAFGDSNTRLGVAVLMREVLPGIDIDPSTPGLTGQLASASATTIQSASFSPPANSLVVVLYGFGWATSTATGPVVTVADSGSVSYDAGPSANTGTFSFSAIFSHYYATAPGPITVTATRNSATAATVSMYVLVLPGAAASQAAAAFAAISGAATSLTGSITTTQPRSWVLLTVTENNAFAPTAVAGTTLQGSYEDSVNGIESMFGAQTPATITPGATTPGWTATSTGYSWAALEILPVQAAPAPVAPYAGGQAYRRRVAKRRQQVFPVAATTAVTITATAAATGAGAATALAAQDAGTLTTAAGAGAVSGLSAQAVPAAGAGAGAAAGAAAQASKAAAAGAGTVTAVATVIIHAAATGAGAATALAAQDASAASSGTATAVATTSTPRFTGFTMDLTNRSGMAGKALTTTDEGGLATVPFTGGGSPQTQQTLPASLESFTDYLQAFPWPATVGCFMNTNTPGSGGNIALLYYGTGSGGSATNGGYPVYEGQLTAPAALTSLPVPAGTWTTPKNPDGSTAIPAVPIISWDLGTTSLAAIAAGTYDTSTIIPAALACKAWPASSSGNPAYGSQPGGQVIIRLMHEFNGTWSGYCPGSSSQPGTTTCAMFVAAWRHIVQVFAQQGATNARWLWCPNVFPPGAATPNNSGYSRTSGTTALLYPGDAYVDYVGLDGYNKTPAAWQTFGSVFQPSYAALYSGDPYTGGPVTAKPMILGEIGSWETDEIPSSAQSVPYSWVAQEVLPLAGHSIYEDASTPQTAYQSALTGGVISSPVFSPPAGALLEITVGVVNATSATTAAITISDSVSGSYTTGPFAYDTQYESSGIWYRYLSSAPGPITVTATNSNTATQGMQLAVRVVMNAASSQAGAGSASVHSATGVTISTGSVTTTAAGSWVYLQATNGKASPGLQPAAATTVTITEFDDSNDGGSFIAGRQASATVTPGATTLGWDSVAQTKAQWFTDMLRIVPADMPNVIGINYWHETDSTSLEYFVTSSPAAVTSWSAVATTWAARVPVIQGVTSQLAATAAIAAAGAASAVATQVTPGSAVGAGSVTGAVVQAVTAGAAGAGVGSVTAVVTQAVTAAPAGAGSVTAKAAQAVTASAAGAGSVTATAVVISAASPAGSGAVTAAGAQAATASAPAAATAAAVAAQPAPATAAGAGTAGPAPVTQATSAAATAAGTVTALAAQAVTAAAAVAGAVTAAGSVTGAGATATAAGAGSVTAAATQIATATAAGTGAAAATVAQAAKAAAAGASTAAAAGQITGTASVAGAGAVTTAAVQAATAAPAGAAALSALATQQATAAITAAGSAVAISGVQLAFTVGTLTAATSPGAASGGVLTATTQTTGGPGSLCGSPLACDAATLPPPTSITGQAATAACAAARRGGAAGGPAGRPRREEVPDGQVPPESTCSHFDHRQGRHRHAGQRDRADAAGEDRAGRRDTADHRHVRHPVQRFHRYLPSGHPGHGPGGDRPLPVHVDGDRHRGRCLLRPVRRLRPLRTVRPAAPGRQGRPQHPAGHDRERQRDSGLHRHDRVLPGAVHRRPAGV